MPHSVGSGRWLGTAWSQQADLHLSPLLRDGGQIACWDTLGCWVHGEESGAGTALPPHPGLGRGLSLLSACCLFTFNLNTQPLHHSCIPESGRGLWRQLGFAGMTRGISSPSSLESSPFLCTAGETGERSWGQILQSAWGGALRCFWVWVEPAYTDRGA